MVEEEEVVEGDEIPSFPEFCFGHSLYEQLDFGKALSRTKIAFFEWDGRYDAYCPYCGKDTVFVCLFSLSKKNFTNSMPRKYYHENRILRNEFKCSRNEAHTVFFYFHNSARMIQKIGQHLSLADIQLGELNKFRAVLDGETSGEFHKAIGLSAHNVGIGAFVYLRRVLERLVSKREQQAIDVGDRAPGDFEGKRVAERIRLLQGHLPDLLVSNTKIYAVLSKGVHELSEQECLQVFPALRDLMFFVLEEDLENESKRRRLEAATRQLESLAPGLTPPD